MKAIKGRIMMVGLAALVIGLLAGGAAAQEPSDGLVPSVRVGYPNLSVSQYKVTPPEFSVSVWGEDLDAASGRPLKYRHLLVSAKYDTTAGGEGIYIRTPFDYNLHGADLLSWDDPGWSEWLDFPAEGDYPSFDVAGLEDGEYYLLALQVLDADGAASVALGYQVEVMNLQARTGVYRAEVTICEQYLGCRNTSDNTNEIASGQPLNFAWTADADAYGGTIASYRHGWDLIDPNDPNDPGWAVPPGLEPENLFAAERTFSDGWHRLTLRVEDDIGQVRTVTWNLMVIPYISRPNQLELLLIDQTFDENSNGWLDESGLPRDNAAYRNAYWQFLTEAPGGVNDFDWDRDRRDHTDPISYSDLVMYKAVLCFARFSVQGQTMFEQFRPENEVDRFVWLAPYQYRGGNYFQVGDRSMDSFLEDSPYYMIPIIFDSTERYYVDGEINYITGFGQREMPDGSLVPRGPLMYPYATAGIAALDWTSPSTRTIYGRSQAASFDRDVDCVGLKGLVLAEDFRTNHGVPAGAIADTFFTDDVIDWQDANAEEAGTLDLFAGTFRWRTDEFVDENITARTTPIIPQECLTTPAAPGDRCIEPMFTGIARMDWMREIERAGGDPDWPQSEYSQFELEDGCGPLGLTSYQGMPLAGSRTNDRVYGYLSYKMIEEKPFQRPDVYWGFDPYRFDHTETKKAIRWVLESFGLQILP